VIIYIQLNIVKQGELKNSSPFLLEECMSEYLNKIKELSIPVVESKNLELVDVVLRKEFGVNVISIVIDNPETFTMDIDEVAEINSEILDLVNDFIPDGYYLEVTTPGIERELKTEKDFNRAIDKYIYIKTYQKIDNAFGLKEINGYLKEVLDEEYVVEVLHMGRRKIVNIQKSAVAKIRLAVKF
jgi:ribosome maturation factor RimP